MNKFRTHIKQLFEFLFWRSKKLKEKELSFQHYKEFYTKCFALTDSDYQDKKVLDIGCGPRGSLEWADMATWRVGVDPLVDRYMKMGCSEHKMQYIRAGAESLPFDDNTFDFVSSFNSIDHVENLHDACKEIVRVLKPGGLLLLIVDVHPRPTLTEPQILHWDFLKKYFGELKVLEERHLVQVHKHAIYKNVRENRLLRLEQNHGVLTAKLKKIGF